MMQPTDSNLIELDLIALADGELDVAGMRRVEAYVRQCEQQAKQVADQHTKPQDQPTQTPNQKSIHAASAHNAPDLAQVRALLLKQHIRLSMQASTPAVPASLEHQIAQMLRGPAIGATEATGTTGTSTTAAATLPPLKITDTAAPTASSPARSPWLFATRWAPAAVAAMLLIGVLLTQALQPTQPAGTRVADNATHSPSVFGALTPTSNNNTRPNPAVLTTSPQAPVAYAQLSSDRINLFGQRHSMCSKKLESLYRSSEFPVEVAKMPEAIAERLGSKEPKGSLDLSQSGYQFSKAGECRVPGQASVHLVYRTKTSDDSVSLWVVTYNGKPQLAEGTLYQGDPADSDHPIFFFRQDDLVYYLVGNAFDHTRTTAQKLVVASR